MTEQNEVKKQAKEFRRTVALICDWYEVESADAIQSIIFTGFEGAGDALKEITTLKAEVAKLKQAIKQLQK